MNKSQLYESKAAFLEHLLRINVIDLHELAHQAKALVDLAYLLEFYIKEQRVAVVNEAVLDELQRALWAMIVQQRRHRRRPWAAWANWTRRRQETHSALAAFLIWADLLRNVKCFASVVEAKQMHEWTEVQSTLKHAIKAGGGSLSAETKQKEALDAFDRVHTFFAGGMDLNGAVEKDQAIEKHRENEKNEPSIKILYPPASLYYDRDLSTLYDMYKWTQPGHGLDSAQHVMLLQRQYGLNQLPPARLPSAWRILLHQFTDLMVILLLIASVVEGAQQDFHSMAILLVVIVLNTIIGFTQEWKASRTLSTLMNMSVPQARVIRDGHQQLIASRDVVPGDLCVIQEGDVVPADLRLVHASQLEVVESVLTGESLPVPKHTQPIYANVPRIPLGDCYGNAFMSTVVVRGRGTGIVTRTGMSSEIGKISAALQKRSKAKTKIQIKLDKLGKCLVALAAVLCACVVVIGVAWKRNLQEMLNVGLSLAVSVIPEGLVAVTTVTMALAVRRMAKRNCLVRTLPAVETLGSVTTICSDKTGTLTEGRMNAAMLWTSNNVTYDIQGISASFPLLGGIERRGDDLRDDTFDADLVLPHAMLVCALCHHASLQPPPTMGMHNVDDDEDACVALPMHGAEHVASRMPLTDAAWVSMGDPLELALLAVAMHTGRGPATWRASFYHEKPFDRDRKMMSMLYALGPPQKGQTKENDASSSSSSSSSLPSSSLSPWIMVSKGAPEMILARCEFSHNSQGEVEPLTVEKRAQAAAQHQAMAAQGLRVIGLALKSSFPKKATPCSSSIDSHRNSDDGLASPLRSSSSSMSTTAADQISALDLSKQTLVADSAVDDDDHHRKQQHMDALFDEDHLVLVGFVAVKDPPKQGIIDAIAACQNAGIEVIMMTGDHPITAAAIANQVGILQSDPGDIKQSLLMHGQEVDMLSSERIRALDPFPRVFARVSPDHKLKIIEALQQQGKVVAMTGDGVNDAMAIKQADIGIAMGSGTETTKLVADMILLDNDFATLVDAIEEGRHVFDNILKFVVYLLSCNGAEIFLMLVSAVADLDMPLTVMMILWANIIADIPPAMAIGVEKKEKGLMQRTPRDPGRAIVTRVVWAVIGCQALFMASMTIMAYCIALYVRHLSLAQAQSLAFTSLTTMQLLHAFLSKSIHQSLVKTSLLDNFWLIGAFVVSFGLMLVGIYAPGISAWLQLTNVDALSWAMIGACCLLQIAFVELGKWLIRASNAIL